MLPVAQSAPNKAHVVRYRNWCEDTGAACGHPGNAVERSTPYSDGQQWRVDCRCGVCGHKWMEVEDG